MAGAMSAGTGGGMALPESLSQGTANNAELRLLSAPGRAVPADMSITSNSLCMKLLVKSRLPSFPPVPSNGGKLVSSLVITTEQSMADRQ